jgi:hypothetical protein
MSLQTALTAKLLDNLPDNADVNTATVYVQYDSINNLFDATVYYRPKGGGDKRRRDYQWTLTGTGDESVTFE